MKPATARAKVAEVLPRAYEPLLLSFYGLDSKLKRGFLIIGDDYGTEIRLNLTGGDIQSMDPNGELQTRFMNSSIEQLSQFIKAYDEFVVLWEGEQNAVAMSQQLQLLRSLFLTVDEAALAKTENWWSTILEQLELEVR